MMSAEKIAAVLAELGYRLEHDMYPNDVREWAPDEAAAYRDNGRFQEGRNAVYALRNTKLAAMLEPVIREAQAEALERAADVTPLGRDCPSCGAKPGYACYGNGPMRYPHQDRGLTRSYLRARAAGIRERKQ